MHVTHDTNTEHDFPVGGSTKNSLPQPLIYTSFNPATLELHRKLTADKLHPGTFTGTPAVGAKAAGRAEKSSRSLTRPADDRGAQTVTKTQ